jgi:hypothetical protein
LLVTLAATGTEPESTSPWIGFVTETVGLLGGGGGPPDTTLIVVAGAVATSPLESVARALNAWLPSGVLPTVQLKA